MTFDLTADQQAARDQARAFAATRLSAAAAEIDRTGAVPAAIAGEAAILVDECVDAGAVVAALEELAVASGAVALAAATGPDDGSPLDLAGLRGGRLPADSPRTQLTLAAVALGLGRAALDHALADLRRTKDEPREGRERPHWVVADGATELDAARLLTQAAAQALDAGDAETEVAMARLAASVAARAAVDAALRIGGPDAYREGAVPERLTRDVRALTLLLGTEEDQRATAARGLLPQ